MTASEKRLWKLLRAEENAHFRRQVVVDDYVFDFGDYSARLLIELDGAIHRLNDVKERDEAKEAHALRQGFRILRVANSDVWDRPDWVLDQVRARRDAPHPLRRSNRSTGPICRPSAERSSAPPRKGEGE
jgi:very-short-patch-repair endonuclease